MKAGRWPEAQGPAPAAWAQGLAFPAPAQGRSAHGWHLFPVRVHYEDTDLSGMVYHANYLRYCERARSDILRRLGIDQRAAVEAGLGAYAVASAQVRWQQPARLEDALVVASRVIEVRGASVRLHQRILRPRQDGADAIMALEVRIGFVAADGKPRRQPDAWRTALEIGLGDEP